MSDRVFGAIGLALALVYVWRATLIQTSFISDAVGPKTFPFVIAAVLGLSSLYCLVRPDPARNGRGSAASRRSRSPRWCFSPTRWCCPRSAS